ncbi:hypothetical protein [Thomasclavelia cocleata]|uniref:hypothetical protein n=1 Tax=Thomasclavelia cocleata TaxID=69824 RepID=UPI00256F3871|nr:hypothetical protein [Thomasclavelia cocleata]
MRIELFGYYFYPAFFVTIILVPIIIVGAVILIRKLIERKNVYSSSKITSYEKKHIPPLIEAEKKLTNNEEYIKILDELEEYVKECTYWNIDELLEIDKDAIILLSSLLFDEVKEKHKKDPDKCVLLLHTIDIINGNYDYETKVQWMADDMTELNNHYKMGQDEAKLLFLCDSSLERLIDEYVNIDSNKIPAITEAIPELVGLEREDIASAIRDIEHCIDFTELKSSTFNILELSLIDMLDKVINTQEKDSFDEFYISYFRSLACIIDRQLYDAILKTIED